MDLPKKTLTRRIGSHQILTSDYELDLELPDNNVWNFLYPKVQNFPQRTVYINSENEESLTYKEYIDQSLCWAKELKALFSLPSKSRALILLPDCPEYLPVLMGFFAIGIPVCPTKHDCSVQFLENVLKVVQPNIVVAEPDISLKTLTICLNSLELNLKPKIYVKGRLANYTCINDILKSGDLLNVADAGKFDSSETCWICFSSGTTGVPKGIHISHRAFVNCCEIYSLDYICPFKNKDKSKQGVVLFNFPIGHVYGILHCCIIIPIHGYKLVNTKIDDTTPETLYRYIMKYKPDVLMIRGFVLDPLSKLDNLKNLSFINTVCSTGSIARVEIFERLKKKIGKDSLRITNCYGMSEVSAVAMTSLKDQEKVHLRIVPTTKLRFVDLTTGQDISKPRQLGEIFIQSPCMMIGYLDNPEATKAALLPDNWFRSGDIGYFDEDGYIYIVERVKDVISVSGKQIYPSMVEEMLLKMHGMKDVGVIGIEGPSTTQELILAFVVTINPGELSEQEILQFVEQNTKETPELRITGGIQFLEELPRNPMGKLIRRSLKKKYMFNYF